MKKTLLVTLEYPPSVGGVATYYAHLVNELPSDSIVVLHNNDDALLFRRLWPRWFKALWSTWRAIRKQNIECLLVGQILPLGTVALILHKLTGIPYIVMTHAMDVTLPFSNEGSTRKQKLVKQILKHAAAVTTVSQFTKQHLVSIGVAESQIHIVSPCPHITPETFPVSIDTVIERDKIEHTDGKQIILSVGRLVERKGVDRVIEAMANVKTTHPNALYIIAGNGSYAYELKKLVEQFGLQKHVRFVGKLSDQELAEWYQRCDVFVMPSRQLSNRDVEGFGIVYLEANSFGKAVIGGNSGGVADAVIHEETGLIVDPNDVDAITQALQRLLTDHSLAIRLGNQGKHRVEKQFQWPIQAKMLEQLISSL